MIQAKCIKKFRDKKGNIYGYKLIDLNGQTKDVYSDSLKNAIKNNQIHIINLTLTSDNRLINTSEKLLKNTRILGKDLNDRKHKIDAVSNEYAVKLIFALSKYFNKSICDIINILDEINYWSIINDSETCCLLAHDGIKSNIKEIEESINEVLSRN